MNATPGVVIDYDGRINLQGLVKLVMGRPVQYIIIEHTSDHADNLTKNIEQLCDKVAQRCSTLVQQANTAVNTFQRAISLADQLCCC
eukprot:8020514-Lingulodinium_polyedra.AAC.1